MRHVEPYPLNYIVLEHHTSLEEDCIRFTFLERLLVWGGCVLGRVIRLVAKVLPLEFGISLQFLPGCCLTLLCCGLQHSAKLPQGSLYFTEDIVPFKQTHTNNRFHVNSKYGTSATMIQRTRYPCSTKHQVYEHGM